MRITPYLVVLFAASAAACSSSNSTQPKPEQVNIGQAVNMAGTAGEKITATVQKVVDPADAAEGVTVPAGMRLMAFQFQMENNGSIAYTDDPATAQVVDSAGKSYSPAQVLPEVLSDAANGATGEDSTIPPGNSAMGVVVFEVPISAKLVQARLVLDHGTGPQGWWHLG